MEHEGIDYREEPVSSVPTRVWSFWKKVSNCGMDNFCNSSPATLRGVKRLPARTFPVYEADLMDYNAVKKVFAKIRLDAVIHFAGLKAVGESVSKPLDYYRNNLIGTLNLLEVMKEHDVKKLVFSSSATVYGMNNGRPSGRICRVQAPPIPTGRQS